MAKHRTKKSHKGGKKHKGMKIHGGFKSIEHKKGKKKR